MELTPPFAIENGRYSVLAELGRGAHAAVFRARDEESGRDVAIKFLRSDITERGIAARFTREISILSALDHSHIAPVYAAGEWDGRMYFVSALAEGASLDVRMRTERPLPIADALAIAMDIAGALDYAHEKGVVHRDVKPENILLDGDGALLADFGIARAAGLAIEQALITSTGIAVGTLLYMSPEQICADPNVDGRSDQYSLALVLYEMLAGVRPHVSASVEGLRLLRLSGRQHALRDHRPQVQPHVEHAVMRALSAAPADRFATCGEFAEALADASRVVPSVNTTAGAVPAFSDTHAVSGRTFARAATVVGVAAVLGVGAFMWRGRLDLRATPTMGLAEQPPTLSVELRDAGSAPNAAVSDVLTRLGAELSAWQDVHVASAGAAPIENANALTATLTMSGTNNDSSALLVRVRDQSAERAVEPVRFANASGVSADAIQRLAMQVIGGVYVSPDSTPGFETLRVAHRNALHQYARAWSVFRSGQLDSAAVLFRAAWTAVPDFAAAQFRAVQTLAWTRRRATNEWRADAERLLGASAQLGVTDSLNVRALIALGSNDYPAACAAYREALQHDAASFVALFGLGECQRLDRIVVRDQRSPTGFAFRANHLAALRAYTAALDRIPSPKLGGLFSTPSRVTYSATLQIRLGTLESETGEAMAALPALSGDSVVLWPITSAESEAAGPRATPSTYMQAVRKARAMFVEFADRWVTRAPQSFSARMGYALALELNGATRVYRTVPAGSDALGALERAAALASTVDDSVSVAVATARVHVRSGDFAAAARVARNALSAWAVRVPSVSAQLAPLAALFGDTQDLAPLQASTAALQRGATPALPPWLAERYGKAFAAAALGRCSGLDSMIAAVDSGLATHFAPNELDHARDAWLTPVSRLGVPCLGTNPGPHLSATVPLDRAVRAVVARDTRSARAILDSLTARRRGSSTGASSWDQEFAESWLLVQVGDSAEALRRLEGSLNDLNGMSEYTLSEVSMASGLRSGLALATQLVAMRPASAQSSKWRELLRVLGK